MKQADKIMEIFRKVKRLRLFEPAVRVLGSLFVTIFIIFCLFLVDYRSEPKGLRFLIQNDRFQWLRFDGGYVNQSRKKADILGECNIFEGDWVWDESYPLYKSEECRFLDEGFRCTENRRPDSFYTKWRWQPKNCNLPRFEAHILLENLRNKRLVFVGDSIGRNQWESLLCMLSSAVSNKTSIYEVNGNPITKHKGFLIFKFSEYNCTVEYYRAPFLVLQSRPPANVPPEIKTTLKLDQMDWSSSQWKDADLLVFNTGHWWNQEKTLNGGCFFQEGSEVKHKMRVEEAYRKSLETVVEWIHHELNPSKTQVFFRTYSPVHFRGGDWNSGGTCHLETLPELGSSLVSSHTWDRYSIFSEVISEYSNTSKPRAFDILNITHMSSRRRDGHSSLYYLGPKIGPSALNRQDCSHWCLPGVPDAWNELLYVLIIKRYSIRHQIHQH